MAALPIESLIKSATLRLAESGSDSPALDAAVLLCHILDKPRSYLLTWPEKILSEKDYVGYEALLERRINGEPVAYILGEREFWSLPLKVSTSTLIPRPDTERLVEVALDKVDENAQFILDLGTGTGAIALALASELPALEVTGIDIRPEAVALATENSDRLNIKNVKFVQGSWFEPLESGTKFAVIVSNPPYIDDQDPHLKQGDVRFEPASALVAEEHGLADIRHIATQARDYLNNGGWLIFEHGYQQAIPVGQLLTELGFCEVFTEKDYADNDRVTGGRYYREC